VFNFFIPHDQITEDKRLLDFFSFEKINPERKTAPAGAAHQIAKTRLFKPRQP